MLWTCLLMYISINQSINQWCYSADFGITATFVPSFGINTNAAALVMPL